MLVVLVRVCVSCACEGVLVVLVRVCVSCL